MSLRVTSNLTLIFLLLVCLTAVNCGLDRILSPESESDSVDFVYPKAISALSSEELEKLQTEFDILNNNKIRSRLNKFGLTGRDFALRDNPGIVISEDKAIEIAINTLIKNSKFTNVQNSLELEKCGYEIRYSNDEKTHWGVYFRRQNYHGLEVIGARIQVLLYGDGVFNIDGFWYKDINIPRIDKISADEAGELSVGRKIRWHSHSGEELFIVDKSDIMDITEKVIYPFKKENSIELHVCWKVPIWFESMIGWSLYVDTTTGDIISKTQHFIS
ncbi:hypothetical protein ACFL7D_01675 [candidate division KSB1 bacterium]